MQQPWARGKFKAVSSDSKSSPKVAVKASKPNFRAPTAVKSSPIGAFLQIWLWRKSANWATFDSRWALAPLSFGFGALNATCGLLFDSLEWTFADFKLLLPVFVDAHDFRKIWQP